MNRLATSPYLVLLLAAAAALLALGLGAARPPAAPAQDPLSVLSSATLAPSYDVAFWSRLAAADPRRLAEAQAFCDTHHNRPNCQALKTAVFLAGLKAGSTPPVPEP